MYIVMAFIRDYTEAKQMNDVLDTTALLEIIKKLLKTDGELDFLRTLPEDDLKTLVGCIRERFDQLSKQTQ